MWKMIFGLIKLFTVGPHTPDVRYTKQPKACFTHQNPKYQTKCPVYEVPVYEDTVYEANLTRYTGLQCMRHILSGIRGSGLWGSGGMSHIPDKALSSIRVFVCTGHLWPISRNFFVRKRT